MAPEEYSDEQLQAAIARLQEGESLQRAESLVASAAPQLQAILADALAAGGWFEGAHLEQLEKALDIPEPGERTAAVRTLMAEEARIAMMVGVAVGWALSGELGADPAPGGPST
jgi:hypothetical protein